LFRELEKELAVLKVRTDGLAAKVGELESSRCFTTTKLSGTALFVIGSHAFGGSARGQVRDARSTTCNGAPGACNKSLGPGAGLWWKDHDLSLSSNYVAAVDDVAAPDQGGIGGPQWDKAFQDANVLGFAFGQPVFATGLRAMRARTTATTLSNSDTRSRRRITSV
jgi:hypothetical protein